jgi:3-hydroxyisobutyrate dehydrogenase
VSIRIGFVGAGTMGTPMVGHLSEAGIEVLVFDVDAERAGALGQLPGVSVAGSIAHLAAVSMVVCMLPSSAIVESVVAGDGGLLATLRPDSIIVDMGSSQPGRTRELARQAEAVGMHLVDAPVSGGLAGARNRRLTIMFGGDAELLERCRPVLEAVGNVIVPVGAVGAGHAMKALNNLLSAIGLASATEVVEVGRRFGLDPNVMVKVLNQSTGRNHATETKIEQFILSGTFDSGFALRLMLKDVTTAVELARHEGVPIPLGEACLSLWQRAAELMTETVDQTQIAKLPAGAFQEPRA